MHQTQTFAATLLAGAAILVSSAMPVSALIERSCTGRLLVAIVEIDGQRGPGVNGVFKDASVVFSFTAKGECGRTRKNDCRRRARERILKCLEVHFANPQYPEIPPACLDPNIEGYSLAELRSAATQQICRDFSDLRGFSRAQSVRAKVYAESAGDEGCGIGGQRDGVTDEYYQTVDLGFVEATCGQLVPNVTPSLKPEILQPHLGPSEPDGLTPPPIPPGP